jgi:anaphase-promoting complex subunit 5
MSRYLTPSKIGLLALISLYSDSVVPSAAAIPILSFIVSHLLPVEFLSSRDDATLVGQSFIIAIDGFQKATITHASGIPGRTVWDLLLKKLWEINSFDCLHVFFDALSSLFEKQVNDGHPDVPTASPKRILLSRASPLGVFVRRAQLEFTRLQFHDGITLWKSFIAYRDPTLVLWKKRNPTAGKTSFDTNLQEGHYVFDDRLRELIYGSSSADRGVEASVSTDDVEKLLEYQIARMQSMSIHARHGLQTDSRPRDGE